MAMKFGCTDSAKSGDRPKGNPFAKNATQRVPVANPPAPKQAHLRHGSGSKLSGAGQHSQGTRKGR